MEDTLQFRGADTLPRSFLGVSSQHFTCELSGEAADSYLERVSALVRAAHLNDYFPPTDALLGHLSALHSRTHGGLYPRLAVDVSAGLPEPREWARIQTDVELAASILPRLPTPLILDKHTSDQVFGEQLLKLLYCSRLASLRLGHFETVRLEVRALERPTGTAYVRLVVDRLDKQGLPSRSTIELAHTPQPGDQPVLLCRGEEGLTLADSGAAELLQLAEEDAETLFIELSSWSGVQVSRVSRGIVGPFCLAELPAAIPFSALPRPPRGALATFAIEVAARDLGHDGTCDPLAHLLLSNLPQESLASREQARMRLGYRVYRDRKFVVDLATQPALEGLCRAIGTRNIIYTTALGCRCAEVLS